MIGGVEDGPSGKSVLGRARHRRARVPDGQRKSCARKNLFRELHQGDRRDALSQYKFFSFVFSENDVSSCHPASARGTFRPIVTIREAGLRWTRHRRRTNGGEADGEIVWSWHPGADAKLAAMHAHRVNDGGNQAGPRGDHV
jgi:hypothetical protein